MRAFIAVVPDPAALDFLRACARSLRSEPWVGLLRWTAETTWHLTLRFLGEISAAQLERLKPLLADTARRNAPFSVVLTEPRLFPSAARPRVVAALVDGGADLDRLARMCENAAVEIGCSPEARGFHGHLTYARCGDGFPRGAQIGAAAQSSALMRVDALVLFKSELTPRGAIHTPLATFALSGAPQPADP